MRRVFQIQWQPSFQVEGEEVGRKEEVVEVLILAVEEELLKLAAAVGGCLQRIEEEHLIQHHSIQEERQDQVELLEVDIHQNSQELYILHMEGQLDKPEPAEPMELD
jgi:hypothetical protein